MVELQLRQQLHNGSLGRFGAQVRSAQDLACDGFF